MPLYDDNITIVPKPTTPVATIVPKATRPTVTTVPKPYLDLLILLTEAGDDIFIEEGSPLTVQGAI